MFKATEFWIGYTDIEKEGTFVSLLSKKDLILGELQWRDSEPNNWGNEDCASYRKEKIKIDKQNECRWHWKEFLKTSILTFISKYDQKYFMSDAECSQKNPALCKVTGFIPFTLTGICKQSVIDTHYVLHPSVILEGYTR